MKVERTPAQPSDAPDSECSIVVPVFDEVATLAATIERLVAYVESLALRHRVELIFVDDGSTDGSREIFERLRARALAGVVVETHATNRGLIAAMRTGAFRARYDTIVFLDADLSYAPTIVETLVRERLKHHAVVAIASPYMLGGRVANVPLVRRIASRGANAMLSACVGGKVKTFTGMVRAYDARFARELLDAPYRGEFNAWGVTRLLASGLPFVEIPADLVWPVDRRDGAPRLTFRQLRRRTSLVFETARSLRNVYKQTHPSSVGPKDPM